MTVTNFCCLCRREKKSLCEMPLSSRKGQEALVFLNAGASYQGFENASPQPFSRL
jgi:hypothetical protein